MQGSVGYGAQGYEVNDHLKSVLGRCILSKYQSTISRHMFATDDAFRVENRVLLAMYLRYLKNTGRSNVQVPSLPTSQSYGSKLIGD